MTEDPAPYTAVTVPADTTDVGLLLRVAVESGANVDALERLVALHERVEDRRAEKALAGALADFQASCPSIPKVRTATIVTNQGVTYSYSYAELSDVIAVIKPALTAAGLAYSWNSRLENGALTCTCTIRHRDGAQTSADFTIPTETRSRMSAQQAHAAALTYARRQSMLAALGLSTADAPDPDGADVLDPTLCSEEQVATLEEWIEATGSDRARFLRFLGVEKLTDLPAVHYERARAALERKEKKLREGEA